jgi:hypothetical protein
VLGLAAGILTACGSAVRTSTPPGAVRDNPGFLAGAWCLRQ